mmetsp:Transcript_7946/g.14457  ORF Transcript_7946/g.14457 Transcript_7946/m.14457 type:complete len:89 (-) Transcript_7946:478-744(-)
MGVCTTPDCIAGVLAAPIDCMTGVFVGVGAACKAGVALAIDSTPAWETTWDTGTPSGDTAGGASCGVLATIVGMLCGTVGMLCGITAC